MFRQSNKFTPLSEDTETTSSTCDGDSLNQCRASSSASTLYASSPATSIQTLSSQMESSLTSLARPDRLDKNYNLFETNLPYQNRNAGSHPEALNNTLEEQQNASRLEWQHQVEESIKRHNLTDSYYPNKEPLPVEDDSKANLTIKLTLAAAVSFFTNSLPSGFNLGVVNTPEEIFKEFFNYTMSVQAGKPIDAQKIELVWSIAVSSMLVGAFIGCTFTGYMANTLGRRNSLMLNTLFGLAGACLCWLSKFVPNVLVFLAGRFISGVHTGVGSSLVPMYLIEISPKKWQTCLGALHVMGMCGGQVIAQILGLQPILGSYIRWQMLFVVNAIFMVLGLAAICFIPESPVYLFVMRRKEGKAIEALQSIRGQSLSQLTEDIAQLRQEQKNKECEASFWHLLRRDVSFQRSLLVVCALHAGQQLVGINAVFYYSTKTFRSVGLSAETSQYSSIGCTAINTLSSLLAIPLIRRFSSYKLLLTSSVGTCFSLLILTLSMTFKESFNWLNYVTIFIILLYVFLFAIGQGPIPYMIGGELFDRSSMAVGMSIGCFVNWFCNFLVAITFPLMTLAINQYVFIIFLGFNIFLLTFICTKVPKSSQSVAKQSNQTNI